MTDEIWKPVPNLEGYEVSNHGRVRSYRHSSGKPVRLEVPRIIAKNPRPDGYVRPEIDGRKYLVHRLVMEAFVGPCPPGLEVCHNDANPSNNRLSNLRYDTHQANMAEGIAGRNNRMLSEGQVVEMREMRAATGITYGALAAKFGMTQSAAWKICAGTHYAECGGPIAE